MPPFSVCTTSRGIVINAMTNVVPNAISSPPAFTPYAMHSRHPQHEIVKTGDDGLTAANRIVTTEVVARPVLRRDWVSRLLLLLLLLLFLLLLLLFSCCKWWGPWTLRKQQRDPYSSVLHEECRIDGEKACLCTRVHAGQYLHPGASIPSSPPDSPPSCKCLACGWTITWMNVAHDNEAAQCCTESLSS